MYYLTYDKLYDHYQYFLFWHLQDSDVHITIDDQMKINKFANYNAKVEDLKEELKIKQNELKNLEEAGDEIELLDDDTLIPFLIGEVFMSHDLSRTQVGFRIRITLHSSINV